MVWGFDSALASGEGGNRYQQQTKQNMTVKDIIELLQKSHKPNEDLIITWWDKDMFPDISKKDWADFADSATDELDWSSAHDKISVHYDMWKE